MWKRAITIITLAGALFLAACGGEGAETGKQDTDTAGPLESGAESGTDTLAEISEESEPEELTGELTILAWLPVNTWQYVIEDFMKEYPGVTVKVEMLGEGQPVTEELMEKYTTRIMAGEGFDIVESELVNMEKCAGQEVFADLYELMDADGDFSREDYFSCIFEVAEVDGKLPAFIYNVKPVYIHLNKKLLESAGLEYTKDTISFTELYELYEKVRESAGERILLTDMGYGYEGMSDYENGYFIRNNLMDSEEYEEYLKMRHELYYLPEKRPDWHDGTMKIGDDVLCCLSNLRLPGDHADEMFEGTEGMTGAILYESMHGERYPVSAGTLSISSFSENKELAWEFIKYAFSDRDTSRNYSSMISPNKGKAEKVCEGIAPENKEKLFRDIEAINAFKFTDSNLYNNLESVYEDYFVNNTITAEECCKELASRVYLYMNE
ncbi:MAG: extracellular solute-binding protein [Lachnospiraceae bacterium]|nr:extracellular solute-binding protein [Lachnospiraceae bacterium]